MIEILVCSQPTLFQAHWQSPQAISITKLCQRAFNAIAQIKLSIS